MKMKEADIFWLLLLVDGTKLSRTQFLNILVSGKNIPAAVLELLYCQGHLADGGGKDGTFTCCRLFENTKENYPDKSRIYVVMLDGASNVQLGGDLLKIIIQSLP